MNALGKLLLLAALGLTVLPAVAPAQPETRAPNILIVGADAAEDSVPRGGPAFESIRDVIADALRSRGFHVFDESAIPKEALPPGGLPATPAELAEAAKLAKVTIDAVVVIQISTSVQRLKNVVGAFKQSIRIVARMTKVRSGELLGRFEFGDDLDLPLLPESCAASRECLMRSIASEARLIGRLVGGSLAVHLAALAR
jgi:hypothetical protein